MITLRDLLKRTKKSYFIKIIVNNKFYLFNCYKSKMEEHEHYNYIDGYLSLLVDRYILNDEHRGYKTLIIYITSGMLEKKCLRLENLWYDNKLKGYEGKDRYLCW